MACTHRPMNEYLIYTTGTYGGPIGLMQNEWKNGPFIQQNKYKPPKNSTTIHNRIILHKIYFDTILPYFVQFFLFL